MADSSPPPSFTWAGASGIWSDGSNWIGGVVPSPTGSAEFPASPNQYEALIESPVAIGSITIDSGNLDFASLEVTGSGSLTLSGTLDLESGEFDADGPLSGGTIDLQSNGVLSGFGTISNATIDFANGSFTFDGTLSNDTVDGALAYSTSSFQDLTVTNGLLVTGTGGTGPGEIDLGGPSDFLDLQSGIVDLGSSAAGGTINLSGNGATLDLNASPGSPAASLTLENVATINVSGQGAQFIIENGDLSGIGTINVTGIGSSLLFSNGNKSVDGLTIGLGSPVPGAPIGGGSPPPAAALIEQGGSTLTLGPGVVINQIGQDAIIEAEGSGGGEGAVVRADDSLASSPPSQGIVNQGTIDADAANGSLTISGDFINEGTIAITNGDTVTASPASFPSASTFANAAGPTTGSITVSGAGSTFKVAGEGFVNNGTIGVSSNGLVDFAGPLSPSPTGTITLSTGGTLEFDTQITTSNLAQITNNGGTVDINGNLDLNGGTLTVGDGTSLGTVELGPKGEIQNGTIVDNGATMNFQGGLLDNVTYTNSPNGPASPINLTGGESLSIEQFSGPVDVGTGVFLNVYGNPNGPLDPAGFGPISPSDYQGVDNQGGIVVFNNGVIDNATLNVGTGTDLGAVQFDSFLIVENTTINDAGSGDMFFAGATFENVTFTSPVTVGAGQLLKLESPVGTSKIVVQSGGELELTGNIAASELANIDNTGGTVFIDGYLELGTPGPSGSSPTPGTLNLAGDNLGTVVLDFDGTIADGSIIDPDGQLEFAGGTLRNATYGQSPSGSSPIVLGDASVPTLTTPPASPNSPAVSAVPFSHLRLVDWSAGQQVTISGGELDLFGASPTAAATSAALDVKIVPAAPTSPASPLPIGSLQLNGYIATSVLADTTNTGGQIDEFGTLDNTGHTLTVGTGTNLGTFNLLDGAEIKGGTIVDDGSGLQFATAGSGAFVLDGVTYQSASGLTVPDVQLYVNNGLTVEGTGGAGTAGALTLNGSNLYLNGSLTVGAPASPGAISLSDNAQIHFGSTTTLNNATVTVAGGGAIDVQPFTISPASHVSPPGSPTTDASLHFSPSPTTDVLTLGSKVTITDTSDSGTLDFASPDAGSTIVNDGTITVNNAQITGNFTNSGLFSIGSTVESSVLANNGTFTNTSTLDIGSISVFSVTGESFSRNPASFSNTGTIHVGFGGFAGELVLGPNLSSVSNAGGTITLSPSSILALESPISTADLGTIEAVSPPGNIHGLATVQLNGATGSLDNTGATLDVGAADVTTSTPVVQYQLWDGGTITGGTIHDIGLGADGPGLLLTSGGGTLNNVTYQGTLDLSSDLSDTGTLNIETGLTVEPLSGTGPGTIALTGFDKVLNFQGTQTLNNVVVNIGTTQTLTAGFGDTLEDTGGTLTLGANATLDAEGNFITLGGTGAIVDDGAFNATFASGTVTIDPASFTEAGTLTVGNGTQLSLDPTTFTNFSAGTLTGGVYLVESGSTLTLPAADAITTLDADLTLSGTGAVLSGTTSIEATLTGIGTAGALRLLNAASYTTTQSIDDSGILQLASSTLTAGGLTIAGTGSLTGSGTVSGLENDGTITASGGLLDITGAITGANGQLDIGAAANSELEIGGATSEAVSFGGNVGILKLDDPAGFTGPNGTGPGVISGLVAGDTIDLSKTSVTGVQLSSGVLTVDTTAGDLTFDVSGNLAGLEFSPSSDGNGGTDLLLTEAPVTLAQATVVGGTTISLPNVHVNGTNGVEVDVENSASSGAGGLVGTVASTTGDITAFGSIGSTTQPVAPGDETQILVGSPTSEAGAYSGTVVLDFSSDNSGVITQLPSQTLDVSGAVYNEAKASITAPTSPQIFHVGSPASETLAVANTAPAGSFTENLVVTGASAPPGSGLTTSVSGTDIGAGSSSNAVTVDISVAKAGVVSTPVTVDLASDGTGIDGLGKSPLSPQTVEVNATVDNYAVAALDKVVVTSPPTSASRLIKTSPTSYTYDFGFNAGKPLTLYFDAANIAADPADALSGSYTVSATKFESPYPGGTISPLTGAGVFTNNLNPFSGVAGQGTSGEESITFDPSTYLGAPVPSPEGFLETITLKPTDSNASGYSKALSPITLTVQGGIESPQPPAKADFDAEEVDFGDLHTEDSLGIWSNSPPPQTLSKGIPITHPGSPGDPLVDVYVADFDGPADSVDGEVDNLPPQQSDDTSIQINLPDPLSPASIDPGEFEGTVTLGGASVFHSGLVSPLPEYQTADYKGDVYQFSQPTVTDSYGDTIIDDGIAGDDTLDLGTFQQGDSPITIDFYLSNGADDEFGDSVYADPSVSPGSPDFDSSFDTSSPVAGGESDVDIGSITFKPDSPGQQSITIDDFNLHNLSDVSGYDGTLVVASPFTVTAFVTPSPSPLGPPPPPPPPPPPGPPPGPYSPNWGDVHITTFDGLHYNFQAAGEFVATKSTNPDDPFQVQIRLQPWFIGASVSVTTAVAIQVGSDPVNDRVVFDIAQEQAGNSLIEFGTTPVTLNSANPTYDIPGGLGTISFDGFGNYTVETALGDKVVVSDEGGFLDSTVELGPDLSAGKIAGLDGTDNPIQTQDLVFGPNLPPGSPAAGSVLQQPIQSSVLYGAYADSWRVSPTTTLFNYSPGVSTKTFTDPNFPAIPLSVDQLPPAILAEATKLAKAAGITDSTLLQDAILDYAATGDIAFITAAANQQHDGLANASASPAAVTSPPPAVTVGIVANQSQATEISGHSLLVQFAADLSATATSPVTIDYTVSAPNSGYLGKTAFGTASPPSGSVTIAAGSSTAPIDITVPAGALGTTGTETLQVQISPPSGVAVTTPVANTEIVNGTPRAGVKPAQIGLDLISGAGTLSRTGASSWTLALGNIAQGAALTPSELAVANIATAPADNLSGEASLQSGGTGFTNTLGGYTALTPGQIGNAALVSLSTTADGVFSETLTFTANDVNDSHYDQPLSPLTVTITADIDPAAPVLTAPAAVTTPSALTVSGTGEAGDTVTLLVNGSAVALSAPVTVGQNGTFTATTAGTFADGAYTLTATETDAAGLTSAASPGVTADIDPAAPVLTAPAAVTTPSALTVSGTGEAGDTVTLLVGGSAVALSAPVTVGQNGTFTATTAGTFADGAYTLTATETDAAGLTSAASPGVTADVDPAAPVLTAPAAVTTPSALTVSGTGEAGDTVTLLVNGSAVALSAPVTVGQNGTFTATTAGTFADGAYTLTATETDAAALTSAASPGVTADVDPAAPALNSVVGTPVNGGPITVTGTGENGDTVTLYADGGTAPVGTGMVTGGSFTITTTADFSTGQHSLTATETDAASLTSTASSPLLANVAAGSGVGAPTLTAVVGQPVDGGTVTVAGTGVTGDTITLYADGGSTAVGSGTVSNGTFTITTTADFDDGVHTLTATQSLSGQTSTPSSPLTVDVDPAAPALIGVVGSPANGGPITVTGTGENGDTVTLYADGGTTPVGTGTVTSGGFTITTTADFSVGEHSLSATETDAADLTSTASAPALQVTISAASPPAVPLLINASGQNVDLGPDNVTATLAATADTILGGSGIDTITDLIGGNSIDGGSGPDTIRDFGSNDSILAGGGNDYIAVFSNDDTISGGSGPDSIYAFGAGELITGGTGSDTISVFGDSDTVMAGTGADVIGIYGDGDEITGGTGSDTITAFGSSDTIIGGTGPDTITVFSGDAQITAAGGNSEILAYGQNDTITGGSGLDTITVIGDDDAINGGSGAGVVSVNGNFDTVSTGSGPVSITLSGANGTVQAGVLFGNTTAASISFAGTSMTFADGPNTYADTVTGFSVAAGDTIKLSDGHTVASSSQVNGGADTLISLSNGSTILLKGISQIDSGFFS